MSLIPIKPRPGISVKANPGIGRSLMDKTSVAINSVIASAPSLAFSVRLVEDGDPLGIQNSFGTPQALDEPVLGRLVGAAEIERYKTTPITVYLAAEDRLREKKQSEHRVAAFTSKLVSCSTLRPSAAQHGASRTSGSQCSPLKHTSAGPVSGERITDSHPTG